MTLVRVTPTDPIKDLEVLMRYVLKYIYVATNKWNDKNPDKEIMTMDEIHLMQFSIDWWFRVEIPRLKNKVEKKIWLFKATRDEVNKDELEYAEEKITLLGWMLGKNDDGFFDKRKEDFYFKSIDWKKAHRLPEAYTAKDFAWGKQVGLESDIREGIKPRVK